MNNGAMNGGFLVPPQAQMPGYPQMPGGMPMPQMVPQMGPTGMGYPMQPQMPGMMAPQMGLQMGSQMGSVSMLNMAPPMIASANMFTCPPGPIDPIGRPTKGGNVILEFYFKKSNQWPKDKSADGKRELAHPEVIDRIRKDYGVLGPYQKDMRTALELLSGDSQTADSSTKVNSWTVGKVVSGKYVMIVDVIISEQDGLNTVLMADTDQIETSTPSIQEFRAFTNLLQIKPAPCHEWAEVARLYITVEHKQLEYEQAITRLEAMETEYFEKKEEYEEISQTLMRAKEELAFVTANSDMARQGSVPMDARTELSRNKIELERTLSLVRARHAEARDKYLPLRTAWLKNSKAVAAAEFDDEQATEHAEWAKQVFSQCFNYEPTDPEMFSDKFGHGFSSFYEDVEQYEDLIDSDPKLKAQIEQPYRQQNAQQMYGGMGGMMMPIYSQPQMSVYGQPVLSPPQSGNRRSAANSPARMPQSSPKIPGFP